MDEDSVSAASGATANTDLPTAGPRVLETLIPALYAAPMNYHAYIVRDPAICGGVPVVRGTRIPVRTILSSLEAGDTFEAITRDFPSVSPEALRAIVAYAAASAREDLPVLPAAAA